MSFERLFHHVQRRLKEAVAISTSSTGVGITHSEEAYRDSLEDALKDFDADKVKKQKEREKQLKDDKGSFNEDDKEEDVEGEAKEEEKDDKEIGAGTNDPKLTGQKVPEKAEPEQKEKKPDFGNNKKGQSAVVNASPINANLHDSQTIVDLINRIRGGKSTKSKNVQDEITKYFDSILDPEKISIVKSLRKIAKAVGAATDDDNRPYMPDSVDGNSGTSVVPQNKPETLQSDNGAQNNSPGIIPLVKSDI